MKNVISLPTNQSTEQTMSSLEIAEMTGKLHKNVLRDIRIMFKDLEIDGSNLNHEQYQTLIDDRGYIKEILLDKELTLTLVSGYNTNLRNAIIKRWKELEQQAAQPMSLLQAAEHVVRLEKLRIENEETIIHLENQNEEISTQRDQVVGVINRISSTKTSMCLREAAKQLDIKQKNLKAYLIDNKLICKKRNNIEPTQRAIDLGHLELKIHDGGDYIGRQTRVTHKGLLHISNQLNKIALAENNKIARLF